MAYEHRSLAVIRPGEAVPKYSSRSGLMGIDEAIVVPDWLDSITYFH